MTDNREDMKELREKFPFAMDIGEDSIRRFQVDMLSKRVAELEARQKLLLDMLKNVIRFPNDVDITPKEEVEWADRIRASAHRPAYVLSPVNTDWFELRNQLVKDF